jgi:hypothetical protein
MSRALRISIGCAVAGLALSALPVAPASAGQTSNPYVYWHRTYQAALRYDNSVVSVAAASQHDFWAVGQGGSSPNYVLHWTGHKWRTVALPGHFADPRAVTAPTPHDVWITGTASGTSIRPAALRWNGSHWRKITMPKITVSQYNPLTVLGPNDVWISAPSSWSRSRGWHSLFWHWNGARWRSYRLPVVTFGTAIVGSSDRNLWAFGEATKSDQRVAHGRLVTYRWRGGRWQAAAELRRRITEPPEVAMAHSGRIWLVTTAAKLSNDGYPSEVFRRSGGSWSQISTGGLQLGQPEPDGLDDAWFGGIIYYTGVGVSWLAGNATEVTHCAGGPATVSAAAGIPGSHSALIGGECVPRKNGRYQGLIMISKQQ